jgi:hypothetical protein
MLDVPKTGKKITSSKNCNFSTDFICYSHVKCSYFFQTNLLCFLTVDLNKIKLRTAEAKDHWMFTVEWQHISSVSFQCLHPYINWIRIFSHFRVLLWRTTLQIHPCLMVINDCWLNTTLRSNAKHCLFFFLSWYYCCTCFYKSGF